MRKKLWLCLAGIFLAVSIFPLSGCGSGNTSETSEMPQIMNGYEEYSDLLDTYMHNNISGKAEICRDETYITEGRGSMKLVVDLNGKATDKRKEHIAMWKYPISRYDEKFFKLDKISELGIDVYNADDREYTLYFAALGEGLFDTLCNSGYTLIADSWNHIRIRIKPWFFNSGTTVSEYRFYLAGVNEFFDKTATLYVDNLTVKTVGKTVAPEISADGGTAQEKEILDFDTVAHMDAVMQTTRLFYGDEVWSQEAFIPYCKIRHLPTMQIGEKPGVLEAAFKRGDIFGEGWYNPEGYDIQIHSSVIKNISEAKSISLLCYNPDNYTHSVSLSAISGNNVYESTAAIEAGKLRKIVLDVSQCKSVDRLKINIADWNQAGDGCLYFAELRCVL